MTDHQYDTAFARKLRELRERSGWSQTDAARHIGISRAYLSGLEGGSQTTKHPDTLHRIATVYNADPDELIALAPKTSIQAVKVRMRRASEGLGQPRDDRTKLDAYLDPELAEYYQDAAAALGKNPDDLYTAFNLIPPDIIAWLRGNAERVAQVRKLMKKS